MQDGISDVELPFYPVAYNLQLTAWHKCNKLFEGAWHEFPRRSKVAREHGQLQGCGHLQQEFFEEVGRRLPHAYEWRRKAGGQQAPGDLVGQVAEQLVRARYLSECAGTQTKDVLCEPGHLAAKKAPE